MINYETRLVRGPRSGAAFAACLLPAVDNGYGVARQEPSKASGAISVVYPAHGSVFIVLGPSPKGGIVVELLRAADDGKAMTSSLSAGTWMFRGPFDVREGVLLRGHDLDDKPQTEWLALPEPGKGTASRYRWLREPTVEIPVDGTTADTRVTFGFSALTREAIGDIGARVSASNMAHRRISLSAQEWADAVQVFEWLNEAAR